MPNQREDGPQHQTIYEFHNKNGTVWRATIPGGDSLHDALLIQAELERINERVLLESRVRAFRSLRNVAMITIAVLAAVPVGMYLWISIQGAVTLTPSLVVTAAVALSTSAAAFAVAAYGSFKADRQKIADYQTALNRADSTLQQLTTEIRLKDEQLVDLHNRLAILSDGVDGTGSTDGANGAK